MKKLAFISLLFIVVLIAGCAQYGSQTTAQPNPSPITEAQEQPIIAEEKAGNTIEITASGFNPSKLTIKAGDTVTFVNKNTEMHWPASAVHPTHAAYPEAGGCIGSKFDACKGLKQGESWIFTFNEVGSWVYHDHLNPGLRGTVEVQ